MIGIDVPTFPYDAPRLIVDGHEYRCRSVRVDFTGNDAKRVATYAGSRGTFDIAVGCEGITELRNLVVRTPPDYLYLRAQAEAAMGVRFSDEQWNKIVEKLDT
jgi:hypothetical protein